MSAAPMFDQAPAPAGENWNCTELTSPAAGRVGQVGDPAQVVPGSPGAPLGAVVSITTVTVFGVSTLPTSSVEKNWTTCEPSFEWSPGAATIAELPSCDAAAVDRVRGGADAGAACRRSARERDRDRRVARRCPARRDAEVVGAVWSTRTVIAADVNELPALSVVVDAQVVVAVGDRVRAARGVPARGRRRPGAGACRAALEDDGGDTRARASAELLVRATGGDADLGAVRGRRDACRSGRCCRREP